MSTALKKRLNFATVAGFLILLVVLPVGSIFVDAFKNGFGSFISAVGQPMSLAALRLTVETSLIAALINTFCGTLVAFAFERHHIPGKSFLNSIVDMPFAIPTTVSGLTLIFLYGPASPVGKWFLQHGIKLIYSPFAIVLALVFITFPYTIRAVQPLLEDMDRRMEEAAQTLGASSARILRTIIIPSIAPGILTGFTLTFSRAMAEFGSVVLVAGNIPMRTQVSSVYLYGLSQNYDNQGAAAISVILLVISFIALVTQFYIVHHQPKHRSWKRTPALRVARRSSEEFDSGEGA